MHTVASVHIHFTRKDLEIIYHNKTDESKKLTTLESIFTVQDRRLGQLTLRRLMSYIYGAPILDVSRSHTTTQHSR